MKVYLIGLGLVALGLVVGFACGLIWAARGIKTRREDEIFEPRLLKVIRPYQWPDPPEQSKEVRT
jgi:hypothetical protein